MMEGPALAGFAAALEAALRKAKVPRGVATKSCVLLAGRELSRPLLAEFAWKVAGNLDRLRRGEPLGPPGPPPAPEWAPFQVVAALPGRNRRGDLGAEFAVRALAGRYCPGRSTVFWRRPAYTFLSRSLGFSRGGGPRPFTHPMQLVGLRFFGLLEPERSGDAPGFRQVQAGAAMLEHNRAVLARRFRPPDGADCPFGFDGAAYTPCHRCGLGYRGQDGEDACLAACRAQPLEARPCPACGQAEAAFDLDASDRLCLKCLIHERTQLKT
jgi:hypothetical protein